MHPKEGRPGILEVQSGLLDLKGEVCVDLTAWVEVLKLDDLLGVMVLERLFSRLRRRWYWVCHLPMFSNTFVDGAYRNAQSPWGRAGLSSGLQHKVDQDKFWAQVIIEVARLALREGLISLSSGLPR